MRQVIEPARVPSRPGRFYTTLHSSPARVGLVVVIMVLAFGWLSPNRAFFRVDNLFSVALNASLSMLMAAAMTFLLAARELDLSIGTNLVFCSVIAARTITYLGGSPEEVATGHYPYLSWAILAGIFAALAAGCLFGLVNGLLVTRLGINSFIVTLATMGIGLGVALVLSGGRNVPYLPRTLQLDFGIRKLFGVLPAPLALVLCLCAILWFLLRFTRFGLYTLAVGSSREAAERAGIEIRSHILKLFMLMGLICGVAALLDISRFGSTNIEGHQTENLRAIAAVVIGGTSMFGGVATVAGSMIGSLIPVILGTGLVILRTDPFYQLILVGLLLIVAVYLDQRRRQSLDT